MFRLSRFAAAAGASKGVPRAGKAALKRVGTAAGVVKKVGATTASSTSGTNPAFLRQYAVAPGNEDDDMEEMPQRAATPVVQQHQHPQQPPHHHDQSDSHHRGGGKLHFDATKAGLQHVDKDYVEQVIQEASKGSAFYQKEQRLEETRRRKAEELQTKAKGFNSLSAAEMQALRNRVNTLEDELEATRDLRRRYIHIDMDMFYAAVEEKKKPSLRGKPFGVGSMQMLSTTNYIARQYGVRSGMPGFIGKRLCPELTIVPNDFPAYKREAARVHSIASRYDAQFVSVGLDELTMDVTKYLGEFPAVSASDIAHDFRDEVFLKTQLTSSGGIGPTSILAKIASNVNKPNGQHEITLLTREDVMNYVKDIPLRKIPGIGYAQELTLGALNIHTCGDLLQNKYLLAYLFKEKTFIHYLSVGLGVAETFSQRRHHTTQSIGKETSFAEPLPSPEAFTKMFRTLMEDCHARCVREHLKPRLMKLVLKYRTYDTQQFSVQLPTYTNDLKLWIEASQKLLEPHLLQYGELRLVGARMEKFENSEGEEQNGKDGYTGILGNSIGLRINSDQFSEDSYGEKDRDGDDARTASEGEDGDAAEENDEADAASEAAAAARSSEPHKRKTPIPVSKFLSKPGAARSSSTAEKSAALTRSAKSAGKRLKASTSAMRRKLHRKK
ncbi:putative Dna polymerase kappa [Leptomonas pyrrhocoris]|uniref:DNA polymerase kappa n=1 Tax=Leptomonas pyrrhocoris TaxID=157538 RepID=A0A0N0DZL3_LEPPY|nr:putative Dna polymerase kappa [Leptomonas pyrrhocoris]KPA85342.1 putative Dna polymerase kappa [Leptomonas pyrrhocoris]|eukprot:XP_015663781.1 putative Dna polymerase kappa [Leptomonas pyrrhocoris]